MPVSPSLAAPVAVRRAVEDEALVVRHLHLADRWFRIAGEPFQSVAEDPILDMIERGACFVAEQAGELIAAVGWERAAAGTGPSGRALVRILFAQDIPTRPKLIARLVSAVERDAAGLGLEPVVCLPEATAPAGLDAAIQGLRSLTGRAPATRAAGRPLPAVA